MERIILIIVLAACLVYIQPSIGSIPLVSAYEILFDADNPTDLGNVPVLHDGNGIPSTSTRWKSDRLQASATGTVTHFIIRVGSHIGSQPVGFAVYAATGSNFDDPPADTPIVRGYLENYNFAGGPGYYAFPFNNDETIPVISGTWYHVVFLLTPGTESPGSAWRVGDGSAPAKWGSSCHGNECDADQPPGIGSEESFVDAGVWYGDPASAGWSAGLLITEVVPSICGDENCDPSENCDTCPGDCLETGEDCCNNQPYTISSQVCCSGAVYTGDCCDISDCSGSDFCISHQCQTASLGIAISGTNDPSITHGQSLTISGSGFGTKNPVAPLWWDDMEGAGDGSVVGDNSELPWVVSGSLTGGAKRYSEANPSRGTIATPYMTYRNTGFRSTPGPHSYSTKYATGAHWQFENNDPQYSNSHYQNVVLTVDSGQANKNIWYVHWYYRVDTLWTAINNWENHKKSAPNYGTTIYDSPNCYMSTSSGESEGTTTGDLVVLQIGNILGDPCQPNSGIIENPGPNAKLSWVAYEQLWDSPNAIHEVWRWDGGSTSGISTYMSTNPPECRNKKDNTRSFSVGGWYATNTALIEEEKRGGQNNYRYFDDVYVDNTFSRVVLADDSDYDSATIIEPQIPSAWSGDSVAVTTNLGGLSGNAYLFVFDADNNHNPVGYPISLGQISSDCGNDICDVGETCQSCIGDCQAHDADNNPCDNSVSLTELINYIDSWKAGYAVIQNVMGAIVAWKIS